MIEKSSNKNEEKKLIEDFLSGDRKAAHHFFEKYGGIIKHAVLSVGIKSSAFDYDDLFNETVAYILKDNKKAVRAFKGEGNCKLSTYLYTISRRFAIGIAVKENKYAKNMCDIPSEELPEALCEEAEIFEEHHRDALRDAISECNKDTQLFIKMMFFHNRPTSEIMESFGWTSNTVYSQKNKVVNKLRKKVRKILLQKGLL